jgi:DNA-binding transcriptional LysR family regulator
MNIKPASDDFDWQLMRTFLAAYEAKSLLGAAKVLRLHQPTVGRQIAQLEAQLGVVLFERTGRGLAATDMAHELAVSAGLMREGAFAALRTLASRAQTLEGSITLSASTPISMAVLPPILARMRRALPKVRVVLVATNELSNLLQREADIALRMIEPDQQSTIARRVGEVRVGAYAHERYLAQRGVPDTLHDWLTHDFISTATDDTLERGFKSAGLVLPPERIVFRTDDLVTQWAALRAGLGIGFVTAPTAALDAQVRPIALNFPFPAYPMWLVAHRELRSSVRMRAVFDFLAAELVATLAIK